jgi:hypothetical protein
MYLDPEMQTSANKTCLFLSWDSWTKQEEEGNTHRKGSWSGCQATVLVPKRKRKLVAQFTTGPVTSCCRSEC